LHQREQGQVPGKPAIRFSTTTKQLNKNAGVGWCKKFQSVGYLLHNNLCHNGEHENKVI
jgi:hypothetical protein